ncbi:MAG: Hint domain-containing protein, partial [Pseudomonadota bacterium]
LLGGIAINEILVDPNGANNFDTDGSGVARGADEYVELVNLSNAAIDISGLQLWDRGADNWFTFPPGTILEPDAVALVVRNVQNGGSLPATSGDNLAFDADVSGGVLNNARDNVVVYDPGNDEYIQAIYNGDTLDDPTGPGYDGFSSTATRVGDSEDFGNDQDGFSIQRAGGGFVNNAGPTPGADNVCFASGTYLRTPSGFVPIERLRAGDLVETADDGFRPIRWLFSRKVREADLHADPSLAPVRIDAGFMSQHDLAGVLRVSRQHRLLVRGPIAARMFGASDVLVPAKDLLGHEKVSVDKTRESFFYFHVLLDKHQILNANGVAAESLLLGPQALKAMSADARAELAILFPSDGLAIPDVILDPSRPIVQGARARGLVKRHVKNRRPLLVAL